jgi:cytochrome c oxidase subunit IV
MRCRSHLEKALWGAAAAAQAAIYASLYPVRWVVDFLRAQGVLRLTVALAFVLAAGAAAAALRRARPGWRETVAAALFGPVYALILILMTRAEEAFHFLEYGVVGGLIYSALAERRRASVAGATATWRTAVAAIALTTAAGWLDEGIQYLLPNRTYDLRDVAFNATAGTVAVAALSLRAWARRRDRAW